MKKENLKSKSAIQKHKKYWNEDIKGVKKILKQKYFREVRKIDKMGGKALKPLAAITAI